MDAKKRNIIIAIMVAMFLGAVEGTVVTTAVPTIAKELQGFEMISWVFSLYLLTSAISTPIYGKLSDLFGRRNILTIGIIIFITGSSLCGISQSMLQLIAFRAIQGLGAGAIFTVSYTIVGDVFSLSERAKVQGWLGSVWGIASLAGPFLGGFFIDYLSWHWIFFINLPFGILSIYLLQRNLKESFEKKKHRIDYGGAIVLSSATIVLLYGAMTGGKRNNLFSTEVILMLLLSLGLLILFYFIEKRVKEPIVPFDIFTKTNVIINIISFLISAILIAADVYLPLYMQNVLGFGATFSGLAIAPMSVAWITSSVILGKAIPKYGEKVIVAFSALILLTSCVLLLTLGINSSIFLVVIYSFVMGFGFGGAFTTLTIVVQSSVEYNKRGAATASNSLVRTLGQTISVSIFGSVLNINIIRYFNNIGMKGINPDSLYTKAATTLGVSSEHVKASLSSGLQVIYISLIVLALISLLLSFKLKHSLKHKD